MKIKNSFWLLLIIFLFVCKNSFSQVSLNTIDLGSTNFLDAMGAPNMVVMNNTMSFRYSERFMNNEGDKIPGINKMMVFAYAPQVVIISKLKLLGGLYGGTLIFPIASMHLQPPKPPLAPVQLSEQKYGVGDIVVGPVTISWINKKLFGKTFFHRLSLQFSLPIGQYDENEPVNMGTHSFGFVPFYSFTIFWNEKWETSVRTRYLLYGENDKPYKGLVYKGQPVDKIQQGQAIFFNYGISYAISQEFRFGVAGFFLQQLTNHKINGNEIPDSKEAGFNIGPGILYNASRKDLVRLALGYDVYSKNRTQSFGLTLIWGHVF